MLPPAKMIRKLPLAVLLLVLVTYTDARILPARSKQVKVYSYVLPAGAEEIRDDINHSFACANRSDGFYVDIDNDCQIFHRCQDRARFSFICAERTVFSQMYQTCVHDGQLGYPCEDSVQYYPDGEGYEPSAAGAEPEAAQPEPEAAAPVEEQAAPSQSPSKSGEMMMAPTMADDGGASDAEAANVVEPSQDDHRQQAVGEQTGVAGEAEAQDEADPEQQNEPSQYQVNADLFDSVEELESDAPSENSAQEVLDEAEPAVPVFTAVPAEVVGAGSTTSQEDTPEVEVMDESSEPEEAQEDQQLQPQEAQAQDDESSDVAPAPVLTVDSTDDGEEMVGADLPVQEAQESVPATAADLFTHGVHGEEASYAGDSLLNAVQTVEELEPIVHDLIVEHADPNEPVPQVAAEMGAQDAASPVAKVDAMEEAGNEVLPELDTAPADMEAAPLAQTAADAGEPSEGADSRPNSAVESDQRQQVNELSPDRGEADVVDADAADGESSEATVSSAPMDATDSGEPEQLASEPEAADVRPDSSADERPEQSEANAAPSSDAQPPAGEPVAEDVAAELPARPLEIPAFVEEMAPLRPSDSADLPELIVSTEFHLDAATQGPAIRRRKTFLFRADAIRSRQ